MRGVRGCRHRTALHAPVNGRDTLAEAAHQAPHWLAERLARMSQAAASTALAARLGPLGSPPKRRGTIGHTTSPLSGSSPTNCWALALSSQRLDRPTAQTADEADALDAVVGAQAQHDFGAETVSSYVTALAGRDS